MKKQKNTKSHLSKKDRRLLKRIVTEQVSKDFKLSSDPEKLADGLIKAFKMIESCGVSIRQDGWKKMIAEIGKSMTIEELAAVSQQNQTK